MRYRKKGKKIIELDNGSKYEFHWCGMSKKREFGVGVLIKCDVGIVIGETDISDPRLIAFNLKIYGFNIRLVNAYAPTESGSVNHKDIFYRALTKACKKEEKHQKLIVAGDFNATTSVSTQKCKFDGSQIVDDDICNDNGSRLKNLCRNAKLCLLSSFFEYSMENRYTWYSPDGYTKKVLDYALVERFIQQFATSCKSEPDIDFETDHRILITELRTPRTRKARWNDNRQQQVRKKDASRLKNDDTRHQFMSELQDVMANKTLTGKTTDETSESIIYTVNHVARKILPDVEKKKIKETWKLDEELNKLLDDRMQTKLGTARHKELSKLVKKRVWQLRNERLKTEAREINEYAKRRQIEEMYRNIKSTNSAFKDARSSKKCDPKKLKDYFQKHFNQEFENSPLDVVDAEFIGWLQSLSQESLNIKTPDAVEIMNVLKSLKHGKAATDLPAEYIKASIDNPQFLRETVQLYQTIWQTHAIPKSWSHSKLVAIWKGASKGSNTDPSAYRGLQIGSSLAKILVVIIIKRIQEWYEKQLMDQQQGFRKGRGTTDGIYIAKRIHQITDHMKRPVFVLFIDLSAAFDHVPRTVMFESLKKRLPSSHSKKLIDLLEKLYSHTTTALSDAPDHVFEIKTGVRQGGPESPMLFNLYLDFVMRIFLDTCTKSGIKFLNLKYRIPESASNNKRERIGNHDVDWVGYADDLMLAFEKRNDLQLAINILDDTFKKLSLSINTTKTKTMILNHQYAEEMYPNTICMLNGIYIDNVMIFHYLGSCIKYDEPSTGNTEIELRIDCAQNALYQHGKKFFNHDITIKTRVQIMNSIVRSTLTFGCQTWSMSKQHLQRIISAYNSILRKMVKGGFRRKKNSWRFVLKNSDILRICGTEDIESYIRRQQRNYLAHVIRREDVSSIKRLAFNDNPRRPGRSITLKSMVLAHEKADEDEFIRNAIRRMY